MTHADSVPYAWWARQKSNPWFDPEKGIVVLPDTLTYKNNYVLSREEMTAYYELLKAEQERTQNHLRQVQLAVTALTRGVLPSFVEHPYRPVTVCRILEDTVAHKKFELNQMKLLLKCAKARRKEPSDEADAKPDAESP